jgi:hypothetical protein
MRHVPPSSARTTPKMQTTQLLYVSSLEPDIIGGHDLLRVHFRSTQSDVESVAKPGLCLK